MNIGDLRNLWVPAITRLYGTPTADKAFLLERELGTKCYTACLARRVDQDFPMADDPAEAALIPILKALAGPHGKTLLKVWKIQKGRAA